MIIRLHSDIKGYSAKLDLTDLSQFVAAGGNTPLQVLAALELAWWGMRPGRW